MKKTIFAIALFPLLLACSRGTDQSAPAGEVQTGPAALADAGDRIPLSDGGSFSWKFSEQPKLGTIIMNLQAFGPDGKPDASYGLVGEYGMPGMRHHDSGPKPFILNKRGHYLLPVEFSMPGEWEIVVRVSRDGEEIYEGRRLITI